MNDIMNDIKFKIGDKVVKKNTRDCFVQTIIYIQTNGIYYILITSLK